MTIEFKTQAELDLNMLLNSIAFKLIALVMPGARMSMSTKITHAPTYVLFDKTAEAVDHITDEVLFSFNFNVEYTLVAYECWQANTVPEFTFVGCHCAAKSTYECVRDVLQLECKARGWDMVNTTQQLVDES